MNLRVFVALGAASLFFVHGRADACSPPPCWPAVAPRGGNLPGNALAIPYRAGSGAPSFRLVDGTGADLSTTVKTDAWSGGELLVPATKLPAGRVDLVWTETCGDAGELRRSFSVGSDFALPTAAGTLSATNRTVNAISVSTSSGSCVSQVDAVTFDITLDPTNELRAYREITSYKVAIDGHDFAWPYYGSSVEADDGPLFVAKLHAVCADRKPYDDNGPELGIHTVSVQAHVAGATTDPPPVNIAVNFSCTDATVPPQPKQDTAEPAGSSNPSGVGTSPTPSEPNRSAEAAPSARPSTPASESGCSASPASSAGSPGSLLALVVGVFFATRSRRQAAALSPSRVASRRT